MDKTLTDLIAEIRKECTGLEVWRVQTPEGAYCIERDRNDCMNPERECREWLADKELRFPGYIAENNYSVAPSRIYSRAEELALEAAAALERVASLSPGEIGNQGSNEQQAFRAAFLAALPVTLRRCATPRYDEWVYLREHGQWSKGIPDWARDADGRMHDFIAARAVIEELAALATPSFGIDAPQQPVAKPDGFRYRHSESHEWRYGLMLLVESYGDAELGDDSTAAWTMIEQYLETIPATRRDDTSPPKPSPPEGT